MSESTVGTDLRTLSAAMQGDREALQAVWRAHRRWVAVILMAHKPREADVEDLLQAVAVQLCRKIHEIREPEAFKPWLRTVALNAARAAGRTTTRHKRHTLRLARDPGLSAPATDTREDPRHGADARDEGARLLALARDLPEAYREPLLLRCLHGMGYRQIGEVLDLPETTIETRIARGRRMLRQAAETEPTAEPRDTRSHPHRQARSPS
ncbi:MAG: RNA polymerase sigma factor [Phycisphaerales bacterium JB040]